MMNSKDRIELTAKYNKEHYDRLEMKVPKGKKEKIVAYAKKHDGSLNKFLNRLVDEAMERDKEKTDQRADR